MLYSEGFFHCSDHHYPVQPGVSFFKCYPFRYILLSDWIHIGALRISWIVFLCVSMCYVLAVSVLEVVTANPSKGFPEYFVDQSRLTLGCCDYFSGNDGTHHA